MKIDLDNLYAIDINITEEQSFRLILGCKENEEPNLEKVEPHIREWSNETEIKTGKSLVRALRLKGFVAFTDSQLNKYRRNNA